MQLCNSLRKAGFSENTSFFYGILQGRVGTEERRMRIPNLPWVVFYDSQRFRRQSLGFPCYGLPFETSYPCQSSWNMVKTLGKAISHVMETTYQKMEEKNLTKIRCANSINRTKKLLHPPNHHQLTTKKLLLSLPQPKTYPPTPKKHTTPITHQINKNNNKTQKQQKH